MNKTVTRTEFLISAILSPLALIGIGKKESKRIKANTLEEETLRWMADADRWRERWKTAATYWHDRSEYWRGRCLDAESHNDPDEDILSGRMKSFSTVDEMLDSLKKPY